MSDLKQLEQEQLDFQRVAPLNSNRLVTFVNHFIVSIVQQLNELTNSVDSRLHQLNNKINICHSNLVILEMKLNSISGLSSLPLNQPSTNSNPTDDSLSQPQQIDNSVDRQETDSNNRSSEVVTQSETETSNQTEESEQVDDQKEVIEEDPRMAKYRKMLQLGIPLGAVHQKMLTEGVDPSLLQV